MNGSGTKLDLRQHLLHQASPSFASFQRPPVTCSWMRVQSLDRSKPHVELLLFSVFPLELYQSRNHNKHRLNFSQCTWLCVSIVMSKLCMFVTRGKLMMPNGTFIALYLFNKYIGKDFHLLMMCVSIFPIIPFLYFMNQWGYGIFLNLKT